MILLFTFPVNFLLLLIVLKPLYQRCEWGNERFFQASQATHLVRHSANGLRSFHTTGIHRAKWFTTLSVYSGSKACKIKSQYLYSSSTKSDFSSFRGKWVQIEV